MIGSFHCPGQAGLRPRSFDDFDVNVIADSALSLSVSFVLMML